MSAVDQVHMAASEAGVEVTIRRGRRMTTTLHPSWGHALAAVNYATAFNGAPDPTTPPSGVPEQSAEAMARAA